MIRLLSLLILILLVQIEPSRTQQLCTDVPGYSQLKYLYNSSGYSAYGQFDGLWYVWNLCGPQTNTSSCGPANSVCQEAQPNEDPAFSCGDYPTQTITPSTGLVIFEYTGQSSSDCDPKTRTTMIVVTCDLIPGATTRITQAPYPVSGSSCEPSPCKAQPCQYAIQMMSPFACSDQPKT